MALSIDMVAMCSIVTVTTFSECVFKTTCSALMISMATHKSEFLQTMCSD